MHRDLANRIDALEALMAERLHVRGGGFRAKLEAGRGRLPRKLRRQAQELADARAMLAMPSMAAKLDARRIEEVCALLERHLRTIPEGKYARRDWSATLGLAALRVLILFAAIGAFLAWTKII
ncbi:MAG: hypothetical protein AAGE03_01950 [Pseudomonadota bacterium]